MKQRILTKVMFSLLLVGLVVMSCNDDEEEPRIAHFSISADYFSDQHIFQIEGDSLKVNIKTNSFWEATKNTDVNWISFKPTKGSGDNIMSVTIRPNDAITPRSTWIYFDAYEKKDSLKIEQKGKDLSISTSLFENVAPGGETFSIDLIATKKWKTTLSGTESWILLDPSEGEKGSSSVSLKVSENIALEKRTDSILLVSADGNPDSKIWIKVHQKGAFKDVLNLSKTSLTAVQADGESFEIDLTATKDWKTVATSTGDWISISPETGVVGNAKVTVSIAAHTGSEARKDSILFIAKNNTDYSKVWFTVDQLAFEPSITVATTNTELANKSGTIDIALMSNIAWEASTSLEGVTMSPAAGNKATAEQTVKVSYPENTSTESRKFNIVFKGKTPFESFTKTIEIIQLGETPVNINVEKMSIALSGLSQIFEINLISSTVDWKAISNNSKFVIIENEMGSASNSPVIIKINASVNKSLSDVIGAIEIQQSDDASVKTIVSITQGLHPMNDETYVYNDPSKTASELSLNEGISHPTQEGWKFLNAHEFTTNANGFWNFNTRLGIEHATMTNDMKVITPEGTLQLKTVKLAQETINIHGDRAIYETAALYSKRHNQGGLKWVKFTKNMRVEVRYKHSGKAGFNEAIWFMGQSNYDGQGINWPACGEIDLMESPYARQSHFTLHTENYSSVSQNAVTSNITLADDTKWNIFWMEILDDRVIGGVNGYQYFEHIKGANGNQDWPWDNPAGMMLILTPGIGGWSGVMPDLAVGEEAIREYDWIRVYVNEQFDPTSQAGHTGKFY